MQAKLMYRQDAKQPHSFIPDALQPSTMQDKL